MRLSNTTKYHAYTDTARQEHYNQTQHMDHLKFPIGQFDTPATITQDILTTWITDISTFPSRLSAEVVPLSNEQLDTRYRPGGWTLRQVVHHCADSHMNALIRLKLTLTEDQPIIKPYMEDRWAELVDTKNMPIQPSLHLLEGLHQRWTALLQHLSSAQLARVFVHPEQGKTMRVDEHIGLYAWHSNHHLAHITEAKKRFGW